MVGAEGGFSGEMTDCATPRTLCRLLGTGNFGPHVPDVLHERQQRRDREALDVAVRAIVECVLFSRGGADAVGLNALGAEWRLIARPRAHGREPRGPRINLPGPLPHHAIHSR